MRCNLGCAFLYAGNNIDLVSVFWNTATSSTYTGLVSFNPNSGIAGSSIKAIVYSSYSLLYPALYHTGDSRVLMGAYSSSPGCSVILGMPDSFS